MTDSDSEKKSQRRTPSCREYHRCGLCWSAPARFRRFVAEFGCINECGCQESNNTRFPDEDENQVAGVLDTGGAGGNWNVKNWDTWEGRLGVSFSHVYGYFWNLLKNCNRKIASITSLIATMKLPDIFQWLWRSQSMFQPFVHLLWQERRFLRDVLRSVPR